ncbi:DUF2877 domain-containing protein [Oryzobacter sp. R7]|uniref:oxamate carbamoyltransferase subunit AllH family protein n=1 Tax=Oryzobacter faecalis TaxID=3388656 RepID=UPI00398CAF84
MPSSSARAVLPAAASALTARVLREAPRGAPREALVVGAHRLGLYLSVDGTVLPVVPSDALALPTALRLGARSSALPGAASEAPPWGVEPGDRVAVGGGRVVLPGAEVVAVRTWRPARVRRVAPGAACPGDRALVESLLADATTSCDPWLAPAIRVVCSGGRPDGHLSTRPGEDVEEGVAGGLAGGLAGAVAALVGRGRGLTPSGDDALAGALLVAHALRARRPFADAVRARLGSTTAVSGALLAAAADGFAARPVVALVDAAVVGHVEATARALPEVVAIGHTSGRDLLTGALAALRAHTIPASLVETPTQTPTGRSAA